MSKKNNSFFDVDGMEKSVVCHHSASLVMPILDPRDRFFYPKLTLLIDCYYLKYNIYVEVIIHFQTFSLYCIANMFMSNSIIAKISGFSFPKSSFLLFVCFCCFTSHVNSYGHCGTVSSLNHTFSWAGLSKRLTSNLCTFFRL